MPGLDVVADTESLADLPRLLQRAEGWSGTDNGLVSGQSGVIDGAWGSSSALAAAALSRDAPGTLLVVLAHPGDVDPWCARPAQLLGQQPLLFPGLGIVAARTNRSRRRCRASGCASCKNSPADPPRLILTTIAALMQPVPSKEELAARGKRLKVGETIDVDELAPWLVDHGFKRVDAVELPGRILQRGGIVDIFSPDAESPYRLELFGDEIESLRRSPSPTQRSLGDLQEVVVLGETALPCARARLANSSAKRHALDSTICRRTAGSSWSSRATCTNRPSSFWKASADSSACSRRTACSRC